MPTDPGGAGPAAPDVDPAARTAQIMERVLEVERLRHDRQTVSMALHQKALDNEDAQDKRQYDFHKLRLELQHQDRSRRFAFGRRVIWTALTLVAILVFFVCGLMFFGDDSQRVVAGEVATNIVLGLALLGVGAGVPRFLRSVFRGGE